MIKFNNEAKNYKYNLLNVNDYLMLQPDEIYNSLGTNIVS